MTELSLPEDKVLEGLNVVSTAKRVANMVNPTHVMPEPVYSTDSMRHIGTSRFRVWKERRDTCEESCKTSKRNLDVYLLYNLNIVLNELCTFEAVVSSPPLRRTTYPRYPGRLGPTFRPNPLRYNRLPKNQLDVNNKKRQHPYRC